MSWMIPAAIAGSSLLTARSGSKAAREAATIQANSAAQANQVLEGQYNRTERSLAPWLQGGELALSELQKLMGIQSPGASAGIRKPTWADAAGEHLNWHIGKYGRGYNDASDMSAKNAQTQAILDRMTGEYDQQVAALPQQQGSSGVSMEALESNPAYQFNLQQGLKAIEKSAARNKMSYAPATLQDIGRFSQGLASNEFDKIWQRLFNLSSGGQNAAVQQGGFGTNTAGQIGNNITSAGAAKAAGQIGSANAIAGGVGQGVNAYLMNQILTQNQNPLSSGTVPLRSIPGMTGGGDISSGTWA
jgi:hypothetical protein